MKGKKEKINPIKPALYIPYQCKKCKWLVKKVCRHKGEIYDDFECDIAFQPKRFFCLFCKECSYKFFKPKDMDYIECVKIRKKLINE